MTDSSPSYVVFGQQLLPMTDLQVQVHAAAVSVLRVFTCQPRLPMTTLFQAKCWFLLTAWLLPAWCWYLPHLPLLLVVFRLIIVSNVLPIRAKREPDGWQFEWDEDALVAQAKV
jgi:hypothetical protein